MGQRATTLDEQVAILRSRGMTITDPKKAKEVLFDVGYYRLGFYWFPFETTYPQRHSRTHRFRPGTNFDSIVKLYYFDFKLRSLLLKALSRIEVAFRTKVVYLVSNTYIDTPAWFIDNTVVSNAQVDHYKNGGYDSLKEKSFVLRLHKAHHPQQEYAPAWKTIEFMTLGEILRLFKSVKSEAVKQQIANEFNIKTIVTLENYLTVIKHIRNVCAHSNVLFDFTPEKSIRKGPAMMKGIGENQNLNGAIHVVLYMLKQISTRRHEELCNELDQLINDYGQDEAVRSILLNISGLTTFCKEQ